MARGATWRQWNNVRTSFAGNSPWTRRLALEPLEERRVLAVTLSSQFIRAEEGLATEYDDVPRISGYDKNNPDSPIYPASSHAADIGFDTQPFFKAKTSGGNWSDGSTWEGNSAPTPDSDVVIPSGANVTFDLNMTSTSIFSIEVAGNLTFSSSSNTTLRVGTLYVLPKTTTAAAGELHINVPTYSVKANIVFTDYGWGIGATGSIGQALKSFDAHHFTGGLIAYGVVDINGASSFEYTSSAKTAYAQDSDRGVGEKDKIGSWSEIESGATSGSTSIVLSRWVDWKHGDQVVLPDTRQSGSDDWTETKVIDTITTDSTTGKMLVTFDNSSPNVAALAHTHAGYISTLNSSVSFKPIAGLLTHNITIRSASSTGDRGHTMFGGEALVHITFSAFKDLGRTDALQSVFVNGYDPNPANQNGRYAVHFHHLIGPSASTISSNSTNWIHDYSFVFDGNSIMGSKKWAMALHDASYGDIRGNVIQGAQGAGIVTEDGSEIKNHIHQNLIANIVGLSGFLDSLTGMYQPDEVAGHAANWLEKQELSDVARAGTGIWSRRSGNDVVGNVTMDTRYAGYVITGYYLLAQQINVQSARGVDKSQTANIHYISQSEASLFDNNTAIGKSDRGAAFTYVSGYNLATGSIYGYASPVFTVNNFHAFNIMRAGVWAYHTTNLKFTNLAVVNNVSQWTSDFDNGSLGFYPGESYENRNLLIDGGVLEGNAMGYVNSLGDGSAQVVKDIGGGVWKYDYEYFTSGALNGAIAGGSTIKNVKFQNWVNLYVRSTAARVAGGNATLLDGVELHDGAFGASGNPGHAVFDPSNSTYTNTGVPKRNLVMQFDQGGDVQLVSPLALIVKNGLSIYQNTSSGEQHLSSSPSGSKEIYFAEQADSYTIGQSTAASLVTADPQYVGQPGYRTTGNSTALTNSALWSATGLTASGMRLPTGGDTPSAANTDWNFAESFTASTVVQPLVGTLPDGRALLTGTNERLALVTPWDGAEVIVPADASSAELLICAQVNGGLKVNGSGVALEQVKIVVTDTITGITSTPFIGSSRKFTVVPWHTYQVDVKIIDIDTGATRATRTATITVVQPHIISVMLGTGSLRYTVTTGSGLQLPVGGSFDTVAIRFNNNLDSVTTNHMNTALRVDRLSTSYAAVSLSTATGAFTWTDNSDGTFTGVWKLAAPVTYGKYALHLSKDLVDTHTHLLYNGWVNPATLFDARTGVSSVRVDGTLASTDFDFNINVFQGDANQSGTVDFTDLGILLNNYNQNVGTADIWRFWLGDFNGDGVVDFTDLGILLNNYNQSLL